MGVTVVIPNFNGKKYLEGCLVSLFNQSLKAEEIIVVDNNSTDGSVEFIKEKYSEEVTLVALGENFGFSTAVNEGIKRNKSEFVALLNNDTELDIDWLNELYNCIKSDDNIFSCCSKMIRFDDRNIIDDAGDEYTILGWSRKIGDGKAVNKYLVDREVFSSCAGAAIYRQSILNEIGLFDENFFAYLEDMDISYRARIYGYTNVFCANAKVYHIGSATSGSKHNDFKVKLAARNNVFLIYKNMTIIQIVINFVFIALGSAIKWAYFSKKGLGKAYYNGIKEGIKSFHKIDRVKKKDNLNNYLKIEIELIKNTFNLLKRG